jgi:hypothetical protein
MIKLHIDNSELLKLEERFRKAAADKSGIRMAIAESIEQMLRDLIRNTPVDTGKLKRQWRIDNEDVAAQVREVANGWIIELINTTEYASWVEKGHNIYNQYGGPYGWVMGQFFVKKTEVIWQNGKLDRSLTIQINRWLQSILDG